MDKKYIIYAVRDVNHYGFVIAEFCNDYPIVNKISFTHDPRGLILYNWSEIGSINEYLSKNNYYSKVFEY